MPLRNFICSHQSLQCIESIIKQINLSECVHSQKFVLQSICKFSEAKDMFLKSRKDINIMEEKVAIIGIFIKDKSQVSTVNDLLHEYGEYIVGRLGVPYKEKHISIISVIICASANTISTLSGKLGNIKGISVKSMQTVIDD